MRGVPALLTKRCTISASKVLAPSKDKFGAFCLLCAADLYPSEVDKVAVGPKLVVNIAAIAVPQVAS
jgi:hypothetical protein